MSKMSPLLPLGATKPDRSVWIARLIFLVILGAFVTAFGVYHLRLSWKLHRRLAGLKASNEPLTLEQLNVYYKKVPDGSNAALAFAPAFEQVIASSSSNFLEHFEGLPSGSGALPAELRVKMEQACRENLNAFSSLSNGARLELCRYPVDYVPGWDALMPHLHHLKLCSALEVSRGVLDEQAGRVEEVISRIETILGLSASLESEPDVTSKAVQWRMDFHAVELLNWLLNHRHLSRVQLARLQQLFKQNEHPHCLERALIGERCILLDTFEGPAAKMVNAIDLGNRRVVARLPFYVLHLTGDLKRDELEFLDCVAQTQQMLRLSFTDRLDAAERLRHELEEKAVHERFALTGMFFPRFLKAIRKDTENIARQRLALTALAVEEYWVEHNRLPNSLNDLSPALIGGIPQDPFTGEPVIYGRKGNGFLIYSVGPDRTDDGGVCLALSALRTEEPKGDIGFQVSRPITR